MIQIQEILKKDNMSLFPQKYLIFDFDGTIDQLIIDWSKSRQGTVKIVSEFEKSSMNQINGRFYEFQIEALHKFGEDLSQKLIEFSRTYEKENYTTHEPDFVPIDFIKSNKDNHQFFLWTSNHIETITPVLKELGLENIFQKIISRDSVVFPKPHQDGFSKIFTPGTEKSEYLMIGDTDSDRFAAKNSGIEFIHIDDFKNKLS